MKSQRLANDKQYSKYLSQAKEKTASRRKADRHKYQNTTHRRIARNETSSKCGWVQRTQMEGSFVTLERRNAMLPFRLDILSRHALSKR